MAMTKFCVVVWHGRTLRTEVQYYHVQAKDSKDAVALAEKLYPHSEIVDCITFATFIASLRILEGEQPALIPKTPGELLSLLPDLPRNENCLEDIICPQCANRDEFQVELKTVANLTDDGTDANVGDHVYGSDAWAACKNCRYAGKLSIFKIEGLDNLIRERRDACHAGQEQQ